MNTLQTIRRPLQSTKMKFVVLAVILWTVFSEGKYFVQREYKEIGTNITVLSIESAYTYFIILSFSKITKMLGMPMDRKHICPSTVHAAK